MTDKSTFSIQVKNFQSLSEADIQLQDGLTIVTGATNNGKSAIVRAVESAVFNDGTDDYIKAGTNGLSVLLQNTDHKVLYARKAKGKTDKTTYQFDDGDTQQKVGRNQLPEMESLFNIREVRLQNNQRARLNFWYQNDKPFLMDKTAGQLYEFLSVSSSEKYLAVLKEMTADMKQAESENKLLCATIDTIKKEITHKQDVLTLNQGFPVVYDKIIAAGEMERRIEEANQMVASMEGVKKASSMVQESLNRAVTRLEIVPMEMVTSKVKESSERHRALVEQEKLLLAMNRAKERLQTATEKLQQVTERETKSRDVVQQMQGRFVNMDLMSRVVETVSVKEKETTQRLGLYKNSMKRLSVLPLVRLSSSRQEDIQKRIKITEEGFVWLANCRQDVTALMGSCKRIRGLQDTLAGVVNAVAASDKEINQLKEELGACPFCGAVFPNE